MYSHPQKVASISHAETLCVEVFKYNLSNKNNDIMLALWFITEVLTNFSILSSIGCLLLD